MRSFVLRARAAPTNSKALLEGVGQEAHTEILAHTLMNTMFVAQSHREDVTVHLVLESTQDYSRTITIQSNDVTNINGFNEATLMNVVARSLDAAQGMAKEECRNVEPGVTVRTISFERLIQELAENHQLYMLDKKGEFVRDIAFSPNPCFLLTDHIPMPRKTFNSLKRLGTQKISLGPKMLFASQCVTLIQNELDLRDAL